MHYRCVFIVCTVLLTRIILGAVAVFLRGKQLMVHIRAVCLASTHNKLTRLLRSFAGMSELARWWVVASALKDKQSELLGHVVLCCLSRM